jgi:tRNA uridine 5-carboxymethylaminomethyl modification enzyme
MARFERYRSELGGLTEYLKGKRIEGVTLDARLRRPETTWDDLLVVDPDLAAFAGDSRAIEQAVIEAKYGGYIARQSEQVDRHRRLEEKALPPDFDFRAIPQLRAEAREKFARVRPTSVGQAARISGISPADIATLLIAVRRSGVSRSTQGAEAP